MPANTAKGYPYPLGSDPVADGDDAIANLANAVDTKLGCMATGQATTPVPGALSSPVQVTVTFPVGRFTSGPLLFATAVSANPHDRIVGVTTSPTTTSGVVYASKLAGALTAMVLNWQAVQV